jgi:hypothetical protein
VAPPGSGLEVPGSAVRYALAGAALGTAEFPPRPTPCPGLNLEMLLDHLSDEFRGLIRAARKSRGSVAASRRNPAGLYK